MIAGVPLRPVAAETLIGKGIQLVYRVSSFPSSLIESVKTTSI